MPLGVEDSIVTGNSLLDRHVFSIAVVHVARGEARKKEVPAQLGILAEQNKFNKHTCTHTTNITVALDDGACTSLSLTPLVICA